MKKAPIARVDSIKPYQRKALISNFLSSKRSVSLRGGRFITPGSGGSTPKPRAGIMSVPKSTAKICMTVKGSGTKPRDNRKKADGTASGVLELKM